MIINILVSIFLFCGVLLIFLGALGIFRFPDFFCRAHSLTKAMTLGITLILIAGWCFLKTEIVGYKLLVAIVLQYTTIPLSGHILGLIAFRKNIPRWKHKNIDQQSG
jgi:monovalent cation/proton antiporter MnhG/PhaG subunit